MSNPFDSRSPSLSGPATDLQPVTPDDISDLPDTAVALYVETGGRIIFDSITGESRNVVVADLSILPVGVRRVHATGTTASGIHALTLS